MSTIVTRSGKGSPLTHTEVDANFTNLNTDKYQSGDAVSFTTLTATGQTSLGGSAGSEGVRVITTPSSVNYWEMQGRATGGSVRMTSEGSDTNIITALSSKGTSPVIITTNKYAQAQLYVTHTASAVNYVQVTGAATGGNPVISAQGSDAARGLVIATKAGGNLFLASSGGTYTQFAVSGGNNAVNYLQVAGTTAGSAPILSTQGSDTNIPLVLQPKGTGALQAQQTDSTATGGNARGANAVDWQTSRNNAAQVASGSGSFIGGGTRNASTGGQSFVGGGYQNTANGGNQPVVVNGAFNSANSANYPVVVGGISNNATNDYTFIGGGSTNTAAGFFNFIGAGQTNSGTSGSAVTTQGSTITSGSTAVTLSGSNAAIKVGQLISGTGITGSGSVFNYVAAISGTSLTLATAAAANGSPTLSFYTPHGVVVGGGNNQATGSYSFIGGGGDAGTAANRNVASGDWSVITGGFKNTASGLASCVLGGSNNTASGSYAVVAGGGIYAANTASGSGSFVAGGWANQATNQGATTIGGNNNFANGVNSSSFGGSYSSARAIDGNSVFAASVSPIASANGVSQGALLVLGRQTTDATATVLTSNTSAAGTTNQVILPNNSAYYFKGTVVAGKTAGGDTKGWTVEGVIKRGANAASTAIVGTATVVSAYADAGAATWALTATADTTNGGLAITFTGQAGTTIRCVAKIETTEMTY